MEREEKKLRLVQLKALNVHTEGFVTTIGTTLVNSDTNGTCLNWSNLGLLHIVGINIIAATLTRSSAGVNPRPARSLMLYLTVGQRTAGLKSPCYS